MSEPDPEPSEAAADATSVPDGTPAGLALPALDASAAARLAALHEALAREYRLLAGSSGSVLELLRGSSPGVDAGSESGAGEDAMDHTTETSGRKGPKRTARTKAALPSVLLTAGEVAAVLRCDTRTLRRWRQRGAVPKPIKVGGAFRWRRADFVKWLESRRAAS